ncbi:MAG: glycosyltransferase family 2 protein [Chlamydiia bacterium]|nr:glycosyltransferase family 2 protein [Chlamydiia bacterium]
MKSKFILFLLCFQGIFSHLMLAQDADYVNQAKLFFSAEKLYKEGRKRQALSLYEELARVDGEENEIFWSLFQIGKIKDELGFPRDEIIESYLTAHRFRPHRFEPVYYLAVFYNKERNFSLAYESIKGWESLPKPKTQESSFMDTWIEEYGLLFERSLASYYLGYHRQCAEDCESLLALPQLPCNYRKRVLSNRQFVSSQEGKTVMISVIAQNKGHVLPTFLKCIDNLDYDKDLITLYVTTRDNMDMTQEILEKWVNDHAAEYHLVLFETGEVWNVGMIRDKCLKKARDLGCDYYFSIDCNDFIAPSTLKDLVFKNKALIAPLLQPIPHFETTYSNFSLEVDDKGHPKDHPDYLKVFNREKIGTIQVPYLEQIYLVDLKFAEGLSYLDATRDEEAVVFGRSVRKHNIEQYICNEKDFGTFYHVPFATSLKAEQMIFSEICKERTNFAYFEPSEAEENLLEIKPQNISASSLYNYGMRLLGKKSYRKALEVLCQCEGKALEPVEQYSLLTQLAQLSEILGLPEEITVKRYLDVHIAFSDRLEPLLALSKYYYQREKFHEAYLMAEMGYNLSRSLSELGQTGWMIDYGMPWEFAHALHGAGYFNRAIDLVEGILKNPSLHEGQRKILSRNLFYYKAGVQITNFAKDKWGVPHWEVPGMEIRKLSSYNQKSHSSKLHICTYASDLRPQLEQLKESCTYFGHDLIILGLDKPFSFGQVMRDFREYLETIDPDDVVLFIDAYDILILADEKKILEKFAQFNAPCVCSTEVNCHPLPHFSYFYREEAPTKFKYLNSGAYMGYVSYMKEVFDAVSPIPDETDDQGLLSAFYLYHPTSLKLDYFGDLFLSLYLVEENEVELDSENRQAKCLITDRIPCVVHGNGPGKLLYQHIYNELFKKTRSMNTEGA